MLEQKDRLSHVELRPMFDFGDHCVVCSLYDAEYFGVYASSLGEPVTRKGVFDGCGEALAFIESEERFVGIRRWYNGNEVLSEFESVQDILSCLSEYYPGRDGLGELAEQLGVARNDADVLIERILR